MRRLTVLLGVALLLAGGCGQAAGVTPGAGQRASVPGYRVVTDLAMPGGASRWEYELVDPSAGRLYLAHGGAGQVVVVDTLARQVVTTVPGIDTVHGLALAPGLGRLYASAPASDEVAVIDLASAQVVVRVAAGPGATGMAFVSSPGRLFVSDENGTGETVIDVGAGGPGARIELGRGVGDSQYDPWSGRVLVTVASRRELVAIDPGTETVVARYPLSGCEGADAIQVDVSGRDRAFVACDSNARLLAVDLDSGTVTSSLEVGSDPDVLALDPVLHRVYVASESGVLTVAGTDGPALQLLARGWAGPDAHSVAVDPDSHLVYVPLASVAGKPVLRVLAPT